jgi:hypothetical protein
MVAVTLTLPSQCDGSGSIVIASCNIQSGRNGGLEGTLRVMDQMRVDIVGFPEETKLTRRFYTCFLSGYKVLAKSATSIWQGWIALFWRGNNLYEVEETRIWGPNVISLHLMMGDVRFIVVEYYIPPSDLETLTDINKAWCTCPMGVHPIVVSNLNLNLCALRTKSEETIAKQVDAMDLVDMSRHFCQRLGKWLWGGGCGG